MKLLHVVAQSPLAWGLGGLPRVAWEQARALASRGHEVHLLCTDAGVSGRLDCGRREEAGVQIHTLANRSNRLAVDLQLYLPRALDSTLDRLVGEAELVHVHGHRHLLEVAAFRHARSHGRPLLLQPNGTAPRIERRRMLKHLWDLFVDPCSLQRADRLILVADAEAKALDRSAGIELVPNPVAALDEDLSHHRAAGAELRRELGLEAAPLIAFLAKATPRKGLGELIDALASQELANAHALIAGSDLGARAAALRRARRLGVEDRLHCLGRQSGDQRLAVLAAADLVVSAGADEIFGLVAFEAIAVGRPVVVADDSGCGEWISRVGGGMTVPPGQPRALAAALAHLIENPETIDLAAARNRARELFAPARVAARLESIYEELIHG